MKVDQNKGWEDNKADLEENPDPAKWMWMVLVLVSVLKPRYRHWHCIKTFGMELSHKSDTKIRAALTLERCCVVQTASFRGTLWSQWHNVASVSLRHKELLCSEAGNAETFGAAVNFTSTALSKTPSTLRPDRLADGRRAGGEIRLWTRLSRAADGATC